MNWPTAFMLVGIVGFPIWGLVQLARIAVKYSPPSSAPKDRTVSFRPQEPEQFMWEKTEIRFEPKEEGK